MNLIQLIFQPFFETLSSIAAIVGRASPTITGLAVVLVVSSAVCYAGGKVADKIIGK